jgi:Xaa-Pro aminopeptidase
MPETHAARRDRLREALVELPAPGPAPGPASQPIVQPAEAALITSLVNVRYLTGFTASNAALLVTADSAVLATDGRYVAQAGLSAPDVELLVDRDCAAALVARAAKDRVRRLAFEEHQVTVETHAKLADLAGRCELVPLLHAVEKLRQVKDEEEIACIREACAISDRALGEMLESILLGRAERHIAQELERRMMDHGAEAIGFDTIVASGPNSAIPHHRPGDRRIDEGDFLKIDFGAVYQGYHADMTRTFVVGVEPADWQIEIYDLVFAAQKAGREALAPGVDCRDVDAAARSVIAAAGYGEHFPHGLGHGVGLQVHEQPLLGYGKEGRLTARTPVTVEPGIYLPGRGGVRIEDTLVVRDVSDGGPELLTITTKELLVL